MGRSEFENVGGIDRNQDMVVPVEAWNYNARQIIQLKAERDQAVKERDESLATLCRLHAAAKIVTAYEWPQGVSPMGAMDEFDAAMAEAEKVLNPSKKGDSTEQQ